jgi:Ca-activated chloride channel family protein
MSSGLAQKARFTADVDQVVVYAAVYDGTGKLVSSLTKEDFEVYEDKILQEVTYFGLDDVPSTIGIVMDVSGSMRGKKEQVDQAAELFLELTHPSNELFLMGFNSKPRLDEDFTRDVEDIRDALFNQIVNGGTALYDAIYLAVEHAAEGSEPKKVIIVFTDGEDKDSYYELNEVVAKVEEADVQVFLVAFLDQGPPDDGGFFGMFKSPTERVAKAMASIAEATGGKALFPQKREDIEEAFRMIANELRNQYRLAYVSNIPQEEGQEAWRSVQVRLLNAKERGLRVRARKRYSTR